MDNNTMNELDSIVKNMERFKGHRYKPIKGHSCNDRSCNPENETIMIRRKKMPVSAATGQVDIYLCDRGCVHVCTRDYCPFTGLCPVTGTKWNSEVSYFEKGESHFIDHNARRHKRYKSQILGFSTAGSSAPTTKGKKRKRYTGFGGKKSTQNTRGDEDEEKESPQQQHRLQTLIAHVDTGKGKKKKKRRTAMKDFDMATSEPIMRKKIRALIKKLLFDKKIRKAINEASISRKQEAFRNHAKKYIQERADRNQVPNLSRLKIIALNTLAQAREIPILEFDEKKLQKYVDIVIHIWKIVIKWGKPGNRNTGDVRCQLITFSTLYAMQRGLMVNNVEVLPMDRILVEALPPIKELENYEKFQSEKQFQRASRQGTKIIKEAILEALKKGEANSVSYEFMQAHRRRKNTKRVAI